MWPHSTSNSEELASVDAAHVARELDDGAPASRGRCRRTARRSVRAARTACTMPSMPRTPKPPGTRSPSYGASSAAAVSGSVKLSLEIHSTATPTSLAMPPWIERLGDGLVRVVEVGVLAHDGDADPVRRVQHLLHQLPPLPQVRLRGLESQPLAHLAVEPLLVEAQRHLVDGRDVRRLDDAAEVHVAEERDLAAQVLGDRVLGPRDRGCPAGCRSPSARGPSAASAWS